MKHIHKVSKVRAKQLREFYECESGWWDALAREQGGGPGCCVPGCLNAAMDLHHSRGRVGKLLLDERYWKPLCREHHVKAHEDIEWARGMGLLPPLGGWNTAEKETKPDHIVESNKMMP